MNKKKIMVICALVIVGIILLANVLWTLMRHSLGAKFDGMTEAIAKVEARVAKLEEGGLPDVDNLREELKSLQSLSANYEGRVGQLLKAEEERLASLKSQADAQQAWVDSLRAITAAEK